MLYPYLIILMVSVDVRHLVYLLTVYIVISILLLPCYTAVTFQHQCPVEVEESQNSDVICDGIASTDRVTWVTRIVYVGNSVDVSGSCRTDLSCSNPFPDIVLASRPSVGEVHLTLKSATRDRWGGATVTCTTSAANAVQTGTDSCTVDVVRE